MDILHLFITAWTPVLKMLLVAAVGSFLATDFIGILGQEARKHMNNVVFYVFYPALALSNISQTITWERLASTWFMPINIVLTFAIGSLFGWLLGKITKAPSHLRPLLLGCSASGNLGIMLIIVIPGTCNEKNNPFGDSILCHEQAVAYASLSLGLFDVIFWSYVYNIVRLLLGDGKIKVNAIDQKAPELGIEEGTKSIEASDLSSIIDQDVYQNSPTKDSTKAPSIVKLQSLREGSKSISQRPAMDSFKRSLTPSTIGVIVGLIIGVTSPLRKVLVGENAPLRAIQGAVQLLGEGAVPAITLIMGGNLLKGNRKSDTRISYIVGVVLVRFLFLPLVGLGIVKGAIHYGILRPDPLYHFVLLVQYALPPAMNLGVIMQQFGIGESECSVIMLWTYALSLILFPLWSGFFMWLVS